MKIKTNTITWLIVGFIWCIFMGVTAVSIGFGAMFPTLNLVAKPFICPTGQMNYQQVASNPLPGTTYTQVGWYCVDERSEQTTKLEIFPMSLYAGVIYGLLMFMAALIIWYLYNRQIIWIQNIIKIIFAIGIIVLILIPLLPLFRIVVPKATPIPDTTATSLAVTYKALTSGTPIKFSSTDKPLTRWNGVPIMPQAIFGQKTNKDTYVFKVQVDSGTIESYYGENLKSLGWNLADSRWLGMKFTKDKRVLLVTLAPATDMENWIVTLVFVP